MKRFFLLITLFAIIGIANSIAQDIIIFRTGEELEAKVLKVTPTEVEYHKWSNLEGPVHVSLKSEIFMIKYKNGEKEVMPVVTYQQPIDPRDTIVRRNSFFGELGGLGYVLSINYERMFKHTNKSFWSIRGGVTPLGNSAVFSTGISYNYGNRDMFEVGLGGGYFLSGNEDFGDRAGYPYFSPTVGYRRMARSGFLFKTYFSMLTVRERYNTYEEVDNNGVKSFVKTGTNTNYYFLPFAGVCFGYSF